jgi:aspartyl protease family protein
MALTLLFAMYTNLYADPAVRVEGLFKGAAVFNIEGQQVMLKNGRTHSSGVTLVDATSSRAIVEIGGQRHELSLHMAIGGGYQQTATTQVVIRRHNQRYQVAGSINGQTVQFVVDTGASIVAMNEHQARKLGLMYKLDGQPAQAVTASGVAETWVVTLDQVKVGEIAVPNVRAMVVKGDFPTNVLLGMSFLEYVQLQERDSVLMLEKKF